MSQPTREEFRQLQQSLGAAFLMIGELAAVLKASGIAPPHLGVRLSTLTAMILDPRALEMWENAERQLKEVQSPTPRE